MIDDKDIIELNQLRNQIEREVNDLEKSDQKIRKHGKNPRYARIKRFLQEVDMLIKGDQCEFFVKPNHCKVLNDECDLLNKEQCPVRLKTRNENKMNKEKKQTYFITIKQIKKVEK